MKQTKRIAFCGMMTALGVVILLLGGFLGIGTYAAPLLAGLLILPAGKRWGVKYQVLLWLAIGLLGLFLVSDVEESLMFLGFFGWYPIARPALQKLPKLLGWVVKFLVFNVPVIALETVLILFLVPEDMGAGLALLLLALANVTFLIYDLAIPRVERVLLQRLPA